MIALRYSARIIPLRSTKLFCTTTTAPNVINTKENTSPAPVPHLPPPAKGWPTPWVNEMEVEEFIYPLYNRGWGISFSFHRTQQRHAAGLITKYTFVDFRSACKFIQEFSLFAENEKHHPTCFSLQHQKQPVLSLKVLTDNALRPALNEQGLEAEPPLRAPGITRRDLRFAILLEQLYDKFLADGSVQQPRGLKILSPEHRPLWADIFSTSISSSMMTEPWPLDRYPSWPPDRIDT